MRNFSLVIIFLIFLNTVSFAQKGVKTTGMAQAKQEMYMTDEDVYKKARELAIVNAIEKLILILEMVKHLIVYMVAPK